jgi:hypothetical protein
MLKERVEVTPSPSGFVPNEYTRNKMETAKAILEQLFQDETFVLLVAETETDPITGEPFADGSRVNSVAVGNPFKTKAQVNAFIHQAAHAEDGHVEAHTYETV